MVGLAQKPHPASQAAVPLSAGADLVDVVSPEEDRRCDEQCLVCVVIVARVRKGD
jgi:hypothetical protein